MDDLLKPFRLALESLDRIAAEALFDQAVARSSPLAAVEGLIVPALEQIGADWQSGSVALSQIYLSGRLCEDMVERVLPASAPDRKHQPRSAIVVLSDFHMLGKRIVYSLMRASGFELLDYGRMDVGDLVTRCLGDRIRVLLISVLMLPSALKVREVCEELKAGGGEVKVIVGGAPFLFDQELWREVGADAMGRNAADAVTIVREWMDAMS